MNDIPVHFPGKKGGLLAQGHREIKLFRNVETTVKLDKYVPSYALTIFKNRCKKSLFLIYPTQVGAI